MRTNPIEIKTLSIDRQAHFNTVTPTVCLNLEGTLLSINRRELKEGVRDSNQSDRSLIISDKRLPEDWLITIRPGAIELLCELQNHTIPYFYSTLPAHEALAILEGIYRNTHEDEEWSLDVASAFSNIPILSKEHCFATSDVPKKSLGNLSEHIGTPINHVWLLDMKFASVDFASKLIPIPEFNGDMCDRYLYEFMDQIFINGAVGHGNSVN